MNTTKQILIYTLGDKRRGMGHVARSLTLADELKRRGIGVSFSTILDSPGANKITGRGYPVYADWHSLARAADVVVVDVQHIDGYRPDLDLLLKFRHAARRLVIFTGAGWPHATLPLGLVDLQIGQSVLMDTEPAPGVLVGPEWLMVNSDYRDCVPDQSGPVVVLMGGSDPHGLTPMAVQGLAGIVRHVLVVIGPAAAPLTMTLPPNISILPAQSSMATVFNGASLFLGAFGMSAYEALCAGLPAICTGWSDDHMRTVDALVYRGVARSLGRWDMVTPEKIRLAIETYEWKLWEAQSRKAREMVDGKGVSRVADRILNA